MLTYKHEPFIKQAIDSVLKQTYRDFRLLIMDDHSPDGTPEIVLSYRDERIRYVRNDRNRGMLPNLIRGISLCDRKYIAMLNGDDYWIDSRKLEEDIAEIGSADMIHSDCLIDNGRYKTFIPPKRVGLLKSNYICNSTAMIRTAIPQTLFFDPEWKMGDYPLWLACKDIIHRPVVTTVYRLHEGNISRGGFRHRWSFIRSANKIRRSYGGRRQYKPLIRLILSYVKKTCKDKGLLR